MSGEYHQKEIERSKEKEYPTPVHLNKADTDRDYNEKIKNLYKNSKSISIWVLIMKKTLLLSKLIKKNGFNKNDERFYFSQLLGMSDHISYNLSKNGYNVAKYVHGPVKEVIPYLIRSY